MAPSAAILRNHTPFRNTMPGAKAIAVAAGVGFLGYGLSLVLFVLALRHLGTARTSAYFGLAPFVGSAVAVLFFGDALTPQLCLAAALMESPAIARELRSLITRYSDSTFGITSVSRASRNLEKF